MEAGSVLYEDGRVLVWNKPAGHLVIAGRGAGAQEPLAEEAARHLGGKAYVVHRLDRETSGCLLFAKDAAAHRELCGLFEKREVGKLYLALVRGAVAGDGAVDAPLKRFGSGRMGVHAWGKPAKTLYRVKRRFGTLATLLEAEPATGRRHQVRVHLYAAGHPVLGDALYGPCEKTPGIPRLMLHAWKLSFSPSWGAPVQAAASPPPDFEAALAFLQKEAAASG